MTYSKAHRIALKQAQPPEGNRMLKMNVCAECKIHRTRRDDSICYRCNERREQDLLLKSTAPPHPIRFPLPADTELACMEQPELFFGQGKVKIAARTLCDECPAYDWCLEWATLNDEEGVWAGLTQGQRRARKSKLTKGDVTLIA